MKYVFVILLSSLFLFSCAKLESLNRSLKKKNEEVPEEDRVSKVQYEQLLVKYEDLLNKYQKMKSHSSTKKETSASESPQISSQLETVDVFQNDLFDPESKKNEESTITIPPQIKLQIQIFRRAVSLKKSDQDEAIKIFQQLELKAIAPVKVRAKYHLAKIFETKGQYDLSLQIFEDIIYQHASSGIVLQALRGAVQLSEKLGIMNKRDRYGSMLRDIFEEEI